MHDDDRVTAAEVIASAAYWSKRTRELCRKHARKIAEIYRACCGKEFGPVHKYIDGNMLYEYWGKLPPGVRLKTGACDNWNPQQDELLRLIFSCNDMIKVEVMQAIGREPTLATGAPCAGGGIVSNIALGALAAKAITWLLAKWKKYQERKNQLKPVLDAVKASFGDNERVQKYFTALQKAEEWCVKREEDTQTHIMFWRKVERAALFSELPDITIDECKYAYKGKKAFDKYLKAK